MSLQLILNSVYMTITSTTTGVKGKKMHPIPVSPSLFPYLPLQTYWNVLAVFISFPACHILIHFQGKKKRFHSINFMLEFL